jgi:hypothetical protein
MIVLDQLTKCFGAQTAVDALSFEIPERKSLSRRHSNLWNEIPQAA